MTHWAATQTKLDQALTIRDRLRIFSSCQIRYANCKSPIFAEKLRRIHSFSA